MNYNHMRYPGGKTKAVTLSYDDGAGSDIRLLEVINKYRLKCTFNLVGNNVAADRGTMTNDYIRENILGKGHEVATHGYFHRAQDLIRPIEGIREVLDSRISLERAFGMIIRGMAYPDRGIDRIARPEVCERIRSYIKDLDIEYCRSCGGDNDRFELPDDWLFWMPNAHHDNPNIMEYIDKFIAINVDSLYKASRTPKLFFLWGHSFEFERKGNWDHLDRICEKLSGKDDVWYATCMEICQYAKAYASLVYSADGTVVYNPTLFDIWFDVDGNCYHIGSGETIRL